MSPIDEVRDRVDIVEVVGESVQLKRSGRSFKGLCPFHDERTPSFVVFPDSGNWRCFGACATGGDVFDFLMRREGLDFKAALELLARRVGVTLEPPSPAKARRQERRDRLRAAVVAAEQHFHTLLTRAQDGDAAEARDYLAARGFGQEVARRFRLGYAPDDWQRTGDALRAEGFEDEELLDAGLLRQRDDGGTYDAFRGRIIFPIRSLRGDPVAFGARTLDPEGVPKYLNSPQTEIFDKGRTLYGLDGAKEAIREAGEAVVVEGYTDVLRAHVAGFENVVASLGTALTEHHVLLLKRFAPRIVLALDADAAGQKATLRGLDVAREAGAGEPVPVPNARGVVRYEHRMEVELRVATLPAGRDPDDVIREDPDAWRELVANARPVMEHLFGVLTEDLDLRDPRGKTTAVDRLMPIIADIPTPVARAAWVARLSDLVRIDERTLSAGLAREASGRRAPNKARRRSPPPPPPRGVPDEAPPPQEYDDFGEEQDETAAPAVPKDQSAWLLGQLLLEPRRLAPLNKALRDEGLEPLASADLERSMERDLLEAVRYAAHGAAPPDAAAEQRLDALPESHAAYAATLRHRAAGEPVIAEPERQRAMLATLLRMRILAARRTLEGLRFLQAEAEPDARLALNQRVLHATQRMAELQRRLVPRGSRPAGKRDRAVQ